MAKKITLKAAETAYLKQKEKVKQLKEQLKAAEDDLKTKEETLSELEKKTALDKISKALFGNGNVTSNEINEIVEFINMQSEDKAKKVVTNDNFSESNEVTTSNEIKN